MAKLGEAAFGTLIGPGFLDHFVDATSDDLPTNIRAMRSFVQSVRGETRIGRRFGDSRVLERRSTGADPRQSRRGEIDCDDVLRSLEVPLLVTHGRLDTVVLPAMAEHVLVTCPTAEGSWYEHVGHVPHLEEPERFNRELADLDVPRLRVITRWPPSRSFQRICGAYAGEMALERRACLRTRAVSACGRG